MKRVFTLALSILLLSAIGVHAQTAVVLNEKNLTPTPLTANGASTVECVVGGFKSHTIEVTITGTATVTPECKLQPSGTYRPFKDSSGTAISIIATDLIAITGYSCQYTRISVSNCSGCSVTAFCRWW